ncbi:MAG: Gfo/Idh/MocA family oxidoreductase [Variibacter sp.]|nr:Gfo/Idh/MocA family oxidoreductase [Variibacter sp.]
MIRAAVIGLGRWGRALVNAVHGKSDEIRFVAAHTRTPAAAEAFCRARNLPLLGSYEDILADRTIDAVVLATPHSQHAQQVLQAAAAGKHVFVEKPLTLDRASARAVVRAAEKAGVTLAVGFCRRFHPSIAETRRRLRDGRLGRLISLVGQQTSGTGPFLPSDNWRSDPEESPAGAMTAVGVHLLDHMIEFAGRVRDVHCLVLRAGDGPNDDTTNVTLRFENGVVASIFCSVSTAPNFSFTVYGTKGLAEISHTSLQTFRFVPVPDSPPEGPVTAPPAEVIESPGFNMLGAELSAFARSIREDAPYPVDLEEVLHGMAVFDAIVESGRTGRITPVPPV